MQGLRLEEAAVVPVLAGIACLDGHALFLLSFFHAARAGESCHS